MGAGWANFAMDARTDVKRTDIEGGLPGRRATLRSRAPHRSAAVCATLPASTDAALHASDRANEIAEIFKKTPCVAGLKPSGRYLAKDMDDVGSIPLLMKTLLDNGHLDGNCRTVPGRTNAENLKSVITIAGGVVVPKGNLVPEGAIVEVAGMLQDGDIIETRGLARTANVKLSVAELGGHETKWLPRATNHRSGALWKAVDGAVIHPCAAHEKQCYADI
jgi:dihydroxyacid dehydratase/phosphogluconate dehydratase